jgi:hydroxypyruvate reductase
VDRALERNDSYAALAAAGDLFVPGPTGTNVADVVVALVDGR